MQHNNSTECAEAFLTEFDKAYQSNGPWLAVVFRLEDGKLKMFRTTHNFPIDRTSECSGMLHKDLEDVRRSKTTPPPLPLAQHLRKEEHVPVSIPHPAVLQTSTDDVQAAPQQSVY